MGPDVAVSEAVSWVWRADVWVVERGGGTFPCDCDRRAGGHLAEELAQPGGCGEGTGRRVRPWSGLVPGEWYESGPGAVAGGCPSESASARSSSSTAPASLSVSGGASGVSAAGAFGEA